MTPEYLGKQPWEALTCSLDLSTSLASGDSISSVAITVYDSTGADVSADMLSGTPTLSGNTIYFKIMGGNHDNTYWAEIRGTTTNGDKIEEDLKVIVSDTRLVA